MTTTGFIIKPSPSFNRLVKIQPDTLHRLVSRLVSNFGCFISSFGNKRLIFGILTLRLWTKMVWYLFNFDQLYLVNLYVGSFETEDL